MADLPRIALRVHGGLSAARCVEQGTAADRAGFSTLWFAENPYQRGVWPAMTACALATRTLRIGAGVFNPYSRHPTLMAMEIAAFDELSDGRAVLGIGVGLRAKIKQLLVADERPIAALRESVEITRRLLSGDDVRYAGKLFSADGIKLEFPLRRTTLPIFLAAMGDQALRLAGEIADGVMISNMCPPSYTRRAVDLANAGAIRAGRATPFEVVQYVPCVLDDDGSEARRRAKDLVGTMLSAYWRFGQAGAATRWAIAEGKSVDEATFVSMMERLVSGEPGREVLDDRFVDDYAIAGTPDECLERCRAYREAGVTELGIWFAGERAAEDIARFGRALAHVTRDGPGIPPGLSNARG